MIEVQNLVKWFGPTLAVDRVSFRIPAGQIVGFLGPNGSGKSTTLRMLTGFIPPTSGRALIDGLDSLKQSAEARRRIGYLPESTPLYPEMRVEEYLHYRGQLHGMTRPERRQRITMIAERCGVADLRRRLIGQLSRGNRQRVGLAQALLHDPPVVILDEPTAGLDPNQITHVRELIGELAGQHTILISTHILQEVEKVADRVLIIAAGRIMADGSPDELRRQVTAGARVVLQLKASAEAVQRALGQVPGVIQVDASEKDGWTRAAVSAEKSADVREALGQVALTNGWPLRELRFETASLEQFFLQITAAQAQTQAVDAA